MADQTPPPALLPDVLAESLLPPICLYCVRFRPNSPGLTCDAFPDGIPEAIWTLQADHHQPYSGDHGIRYTAPHDDAAREARTIIQETREFGILRKDHPR